MTEVQTAPASPSAPATFQSQTYRYRAIERATGRVLQGEQTGENPYAVRAALRRIGLDVEDLHLVGEEVTFPTWALPLRVAWHARQRRRRRLARADLFDAVATLVNAGLPLEQALGNLEASATRSPAERHLLKRLRDGVRSGSAFADVCAEHPAWFDSLDVAMLRTGQQAGDLTGVLTTLAEFHQRSGAIGQQLFVALAYPALLLVAGLAAVVFLSVVPLPKLLAIITQAHQQPPWLTAQLVAFGQLIAHWWWLLGPAVVAAGIGLAALIRRVPRHGILGTLVHANLLAKARTRTQIAGIAFTLARLRKSGMPLLDAVEATAHTAHSRALRSMLSEAAEAIRRGEDLSAVVGRSVLMEPEFAQLLQLGERSGELTVLLERIAERYSRTATRTIERIAALLGPLSIIVVAAMLAVVAMATILPIVQLGDLL